MTQADESAPAYVSGETTLWVQDPDKEYDLLAFTGMLSILVNGGLGFGRAFDLLHAHARDSMQPVLRDLETTLFSEREPLSRALAKHPEMFCATYVANVELGEAGDLGSTLENLHNEILNDVRSSSFLICPCPAALGATCRQISKILAMVGSESRALSLVAKTSSNEVVQAALLDLETQSLEGTKLADCKLPAIFPPIFGGLLAAHDAVGSVPTAFRNLADLLEARSGPLLRSKTAKSASSTLHEGDMLNGRYRIDGRLGRGGMGAVYLGYDTQTNYQVAIKHFVSRPDVPNPEFQRRFRDEVSILQSLNFPGIPGFADTFEADGQSYLVMEYIKGLSLGEMLDKTLASDGKPGLPAQLVTRVGIHICRILEHIHGLERPLIHRDIKPQNIIIRESDERIFLVDFGLAREVQSKNSLISVVGTAAYAPLEQFQGRPEARSDLYSLAVTMTELLSGKQPIPLHTEPIQTLVPDIHEDLARIINRASRTLPTERYNDASDMLMLLEDALPRLGEAPKNRMAQDEGEDEVHDMIRRWGRGKTPSAELVLPPPIVLAKADLPLPDRNDVLAGPVPMGPGPRKFPFAVLAILFALVAIVAGFYLRSHRAARPNPSPTTTRSKNA